MFQHVLANRWLDSACVAAGYDRVAPDYDQNWLSQLCPVTDRLLQALPLELPPGELLDLGCGTGYSTSVLAEYFPQRSLHALDVSPGMLTQARAKLGPPAAHHHWHCSDMLAFMRRCPDQSAALVFSSWAIGYSQPSKLIRETARVLAPGGTFAFVVNLRDTLQPLFRAFHRALLNHPQAAGCALLPRFPSNAEELRRRQETRGLRIFHLEEGYHEVIPPAGQMSRFDWLCKTGVLAGFDAVLPIHDPEHPATRQLRAEIEAIDSPLTHHYALCLAQKPELYSS